jgi:hypothetical protein
MPSNRMSRGKLSTLSIAELGNSNEANATSVTPYALMTGRFRDNFLGDRARGLRSEVLERRSRGPRSRGAFRPPWPYRFFAHDDVCDKEPVAPTSTFCAFATPVEAGSAAGLAGVR